MIKYKQAKKKDLNIDEQDVLKINQHPWISRDFKVIQKILNEAYYSSYLICLSNVIHPNEIKMYKDLKALYQRAKIKKDLPKYVAK